MGRRGRWGGGKPVEGGGVLEVEVRVRVMVLVEAWFGPMGISMVKQRSLECEMPRDSRNDGRL